LTFLGDSGNKTLAIRIQRQVSLPPHYHRRHIVDGYACFHYPRPLHARQQITIPNRIDGKVFCVGPITPDDFWHIRGVGKFVTFVKQLSPQVAQGLDWLGHLNPFRFILRE